MAFFLEQDVVFVLGWGGWNLGKVEGLSQVISFKMIWG